MLRSEADEFMPKKSPADFCKKYNGKGAYAMYRDDLCATAAPSPALSSATASSTWGSPSWNYEEYNTWHVQKSAGIWPINGTSGGNATDVEQFALPEAEESEEAEDVPTNEKQEFKLTGLTGLNNALSDLLRKRLPSGVSETETVPDSPPMNCMAPPGLAAPPGLSACAQPTGIDLDSADDRGLQQGGSRKDFGAAAAKKTPAKWEGAKFGEHLLPPNTTTVMFRNIPNKYSQDRLVEQLHGDGFRGLIDFVYLPIDFKNQCNVGYAFLNFRTVEACTRFASEYHNMNSCDKLPGFRSKKVCEVAEAKCQGCDKNVSRLQSSPVMAQLLAKPEWLPRLFDVNGKPLEFPMSSSDSQSYQQAGQKGMSRRGRTMSGSSGKGGDRM